MEQQKLTNIKETLAFLSEKFPLCFILDGEVKPLKIGIFQDLAKELEGSEVVSKRLLRMSLRHYTSGWKYLAAVKENAHRIDLMGAQGDKVEAEHAEHASEQLAASKKLVAQKREQQKTQNKAARKPSGKQAGENARNANHKDKRDSSERAPARKSDKQSKGSKPAHKQSNKSIKLKVAPLEESAINAGLKVSVKVGQQPMPATVTEVAKDGVFVQLNSGMTVKVQPQQLRLLLD